MINLYQVLAIPQIVCLSQPILHHAGATSGLGDEAAKAFAKYGVHLSLVDRDEENLAKTVTKCESVGSEKATNSTNFIFLTTQRLRRRTYYNVGWTAAKNLMTWRNDKQN
ncbi:unnamed protein product [Clavelina lepadiformis]|uniref:Uncharacterized protein n=1 Tax=Clavelina lepadiformis TaxID=159417 RepID=A0ABP0FDC0_CLALP